jgi:peptide deformylase
MSHTLITIQDHMQELHARAARVADPTSAHVHALIDDMITVMRAENGIGLAAPQVNTLARVVVFDMDERGQRTKTPLVCINPVIAKASRDLVMSEEGCLSIPGEFIPVVRSESVTVRYLTPDGTKKTLHARDLLAIALQHEIDHLDGVLMTDRYNQQTALRTQFDTLDTAPDITHKIG